MTPLCPNLSELYGDVYRISRDPSADSHDDPWMLQIPCQRGVIYPHGPNTIAVEVDGRPKIAKRIAAIQGIRLHQDGDDEKTFTFDVSLFEQVAEIEKPRKRRHLSDEHREKLTTAGTAALERWRTNSSSEFTGGVTAETAPSGLKAG